MLILSKLGQGNLRPYFTAILFSVIFSFAGMNHASAQVDIEIDVVGVAAPMSSPIIVNPNPVSNYAQVKHKESIVLQSITIINQNGKIMAILDLNQSSSFEVSLPAGTTHWVFHTDAGIISKQIVISES